MDDVEFKVDPQALQAEAAKEPPRQGLEVYAETIRLLRDDKGFTFREVAAWLQERGLKVDHNAVWRAYAKAAGAGTGGPVSMANPASASPAPLLPPPRKRRPPQTKVETPAPTVTVKEPPSATQREQREQSEQRSTADAAMPWM